MRYNTIKPNDIANGDGICVSIYLQGCPHHCYNCFNPETWDFEGGKEFTNDTLIELINDININGIKRNLAILGGEPLAEDNLFLTHLICSKIKDKYPDIEIRLWTGYLYEDLIQRGGRTQQILNLIDILIDGPFIEEQKDITLKMRGSKNQRIFNTHTGEEITE